MVSVVIPTHNRKETLERAVRSVCNQTFKDLEIIVVSDGHFSDTDEIMKKLKKEDDRIEYYYYEPAKSGNVARNFGIKKAKGDYVAFLDDDDEWYLDKLEKQIALLDSNDEIGLVYTGSNIIYVNENIEYKSVPQKEGDLKRDILLENCVGTTSTVVVKKKIIDEVGNFDEALGALQDFELWIRVCQVTKVGVVSQPMINYYNYTGKKQVSALTQKYIDAFSYINDKHSCLFKKMTNEELSKKRNNEWFLLGNKAMRNGSSKLAREYMTKILKKGFNKKAIVYYVLSFTNYKNVLKLRSKI